MHHQDAGRRQKFHDIVTVADRVQGIAVNLLEIQLGGHELPVYGEGGACQRPRPQGHNIRPAVDPPETLKIPGQHAEVRQQMVGEQDGLGPLQMGVARHDYLPVLCRRFCQRLLQIADGLHDLHRLAAHIHMGIQRHLVIAAAGGVQTPSRLAYALGQALLDVHMYVFQIHREVEFPFLDLQQNVMEPPDNGLLVLLRDNAAFGQHLRMGNAARDVLTVHALVKADGGLEFIDHLVGAFLKAPAPHLLRHYLLSLAVLCCIRARTLRGRPNRLIKPVASAWLYTSSCSKVTNSWLYRE